MAENDDLDQPEGQPPEDEGGQGGEPQWAEYRFREEARRRKAAQEQLNSERAARAALEQRLASLEGRVADNDKPKAPEGPTLDSLRKWKAEYAGLVQRVATNPDDAEARAKLAEVKPEHVVAVEDAIAEARAKEYSGRVKSEVDATLASGRRQANLTRKLADEYGNDVLDLNSDLMQRAKEEFAILAAEHGADDDNGALTRLAVERAYRAVNRGGRGSEKDRRRLAVEEGARREASTMNSIAALVQKGDFKSQRKAAELGLNEAIKAWGMG